MKKNERPFRKRSNVNGENRFKKKRRLGEKTITLLLFLAASFAVVVSAAIIYTLLQGSINFFTNPLVNPSEFFIGDKWVPSGGNPRFGILPLLAGTTLIAGGALLIGTPLGVGAALYLSEFAGPRVRAIAKPVIELLAGIPSIVYGFFALMFISPIIRDAFGASYFNALSAIIVLAIMILPIVVSISDDAMRAVSNELREASLAVGATKWETATRVVMPSASSGIIASILLGLGRALGETMAVTMVAGSVANLTFNPLEEVQTMTAYIAQTATGDIPPGVGLDAAFAVGLVLFIITFIVNMIAARIVKRIQKGAKSKRKSSIIKDWAIKRLNVVVGTFQGRIKPKVRKVRQISLKRRYLKGRIGVSTVAICLLIAVFFLAYLLFSILSQGLGGLSWEFVSSRLSRHPEKAGIIHVIQGSISLMLLTMIITVPIGVGAAIYLTEIASDTRYTRFLRRIIQNLAGVPSIVFGLVGLAIFVRLFDLGRSLLTGSLTLAIMVLPIIVVATEEALKSVPQSFREAARGLGATRWQTVRHHVLPNAKPGILTGTVLALSRAIGETAPILFIGATFAKTGPSGIMDSFLALPLTIFFWAREPKQEFHDLAASTIIVLLLILLAMNSIAIIIRQRAQTRRDW